MTVDNRLGPYVLDDRIAQGAAADVWRAHRADGGLRVVLKRLLPPWTDRSSVRETFLEIIKDAIPLRHPHIVPVLDFGEVEGFCYVVFEAVDGRPLMQLLHGRDYQLTTQQALTIAQGMLRGLSFVHRAANPFTGGRLLHGDVSPQNILVDHHGEPRLVDLGFARVVLEAGLPGKPSKPIPRYVSPEVLAGDTLSVRGDVYGAGRVLEDLMAHSDEEARLRIAEVAAVACAVNPDERYADAGHILEALSPVLPEPASLTEPPDFEERRQSTEIPDVPTDPATFLRRRYRILGELGRGGMGIVYKVRDKTIDEVLAVKVLPLERVHDAGDVSRFRRELKLARSVRHPNVARVDHLEEGPGFAYYTMEYIPGDNLEDLIEARGAMPADEVIALAKQLTAGLGAIHDADIVHRDLKPANVVVTPEGRVVVMDFGIARHEELESGLTTTGMSLGTPMYMAPEQAVGSEIDERADLYSLGVLLYQMLVGRTPFEGSTTVALYLEKRNREFKRPRQANPNVPPELDALVFDLLDPNSDKRPADCEAVLDRLKAL